MPKNNHPADNYAKIAQDNLYRVYSNCLTLIETGYIDHENR